MEIGSNHDSSPESPEPISGLGSPQDSKEWVKEFTKCPACGSTNRFCEGIAQELKERGLASEELAFYLDQKQGVAVQPQKQDKVLVGASLPAFYFATDICEDCGTLYAVKLQRMAATKAVPPPQPIIPNRAERRRLGILPPPLSNMGLS